MENAFDDAAWSHWKKMLLFAIRGTIMLMLPWGKVAASLGHAVAGAAEKTLEFGMESEHHHEQQSALKNRGAELIKLAAAISKAVGPNLGIALNPWPRASSTASGSRARRPPNCTSSAFHTRSRRPPRRSCASSSPTS